MITSMTSKLDRLQNTGRVVLSGDMTGQLAAREIADEARRLGMQVAIVRTGCSWVVERTAPLNA